MTYGEIERKVAELGLTPLQRDDLWDALFLTGSEIEERTVDVHIRRLREKLPYLGSAITTIKQFGYKLEDPAPAL